MSLIIITLQLHFLSKAGYNRVWKICLTVKKWSISISDGQPAGEQDIKHRTIHNLTERLAGIAYQIYWTTEVNDFRTTCCWNRSVMAQADTVATSVIRVFRSWVFFCSSSCQGFKPTAFLKCLHSALLPNLPKIWKGFGDIYQANVNVTECGTIASLKERETLAADFTQLTSYSFSHHNFLCLL